MSYQQQQNLNAQAQMYNAQTNAETQREGIGAMGGLVGAIIGHINASQKKKQEEQRRTAERLAKEREEHERVVNTYKQNYMKDAIRNAMKAQVDKTNEDADVAFIRSDGQGPAPRQRSVYEAYGMPEPASVQRGKNLNQARQILADDDDYRGGMMGSAY